MASSEPRFFAGDEIPEIRVPTPRPPAEAAAPAPTIPPDRGVPSSGESRSSSLPAEEKPAEERLPPLVFWGDLVLDAPAWLFSAVIHMAIVILLGLLFVSQPDRNGLLLEFDSSDRLAEDFQGDELGLPLELSEEVEKTSLEPEKLPELANSMVIDPNSVNLPVPNQLSQEDASPIRMALTGRERGMQQNLLDAYGGTAGTQRAVMEALRWLARNQGRYGLWSMTGPYEDGSGTENPEAATAMALIAFQGAGYTPLGDPEEPFTRITSRAWTTLLRKQQEDGNFFHSGGAHGQLYTQALCTIALCELYGMTGEEQYRDAAQLAVDYCLKVQSPEGGWRYYPGTGSDLSVTGWFVMALQSARMAGLTVPTPALHKISDYLSTVSREGGSFYSYQPQLAATDSMTAEGLLCRQYLGWPRSDRRLQIGAEYLSQNPPSWEDGERDVYYWYYAAQVCHHMEGRYWRAWNEVMREVLPRHQVQEGKERGSWNPQGDQWGHAGGRLFVTCLSTYMLEVYYRHLPIFQLDLLDGE